MFPLVFIKPHDAVVGLCGFLPALTTLSVHFLSPSSHNCPCCNTDADMTGGRLKLRGNHRNVTEEHLKTRTNK
jgi:hypothetical protein